MKISSVRKSLLQERRYTLAVLKKFGLLKGMKKGCGLMSANDDIRPLRISEEYYSKIQRDGLF